MLEFYAFRRANAASSATGRAGAALANHASNGKMGAAAEARPAAGAPRTLRAGDSVTQGEMVATAAESTAVLQFPDGQVMAVLPGSRVTITTYVFKRDDPARGKVLISLIDGGMRAVTGASGKANPAAVSYRAGEAVLEVQGTDVTTLIKEEIVSVVVNIGVIKFSRGNQSLSIPADQGVFTDCKGELKSLPAIQVLAALERQGTAVALVIAGVLKTARSSELERAINESEKTATNMNQPRTTTTLKWGNNSPGQLGLGGGLPSGR